MPTILAISPGASACRIEIGRKGNHGTVTSPLSFSTAVAIELARLFSEEGNARAAEALLSPVYNGLRRPAALKLELELDAFGRSVCCSTV